MVDEQEPAKRVVKRVVKKTVARPTAAPQAPAPAVRYGRPVATAAKPQGKGNGESRSATQLKVATRPGTKTTPTGPAAPRQKVRRPRPSVDVRARVAGARVVAGRAWWAVADTTGDAARTTGRVVGVRARTVAAWRLPHLNPYLASVVTGAVVGLVAVALGAVAQAIFQSVRGVSSGGGLWGGVAFAVVAVVVVGLGESLLRGFGTPSPRLTSFLAVVLSIIAMLGVLLGLVDGMSALALVPLLGVASYVVARWLVDVAENAPAVVD